MEILKRLFAEKNYEAVRANIYQDPDYKNNALKLKYLASAFYCSRDYQGTISAIALLKPHVAEKTVCSMLIDTEIGLGSDADSALEYISRFLQTDITAPEKRWAAFKKGLCLLAKDQKQEAIRFLETATPLGNEVMELERHFFLNNATNACAGAATENEKINELVIRARIQMNAQLAKEARDRAIHANYGEAEYFATAVLAKYCKIGEEKLALQQRFGIVDESIYYRII